MKRNKGDRGQEAVRVPLLCRLTPSTRDSQHILFTWREGRKGREEDGRGNKRHKRGRERRRQRGKTNDGGARV